VLLTVKFDIDNENSSEIGNNSITSKLTVNDGSQYMLNEGMLLGYNNDDVIESDDSGELLQVYILDKEQYDKIWKDKSFEVGCFCPTPRKGIFQNSQTYIVLNM